MGSRRFGGAGIRRALRSSGAAPAAPLLNFTGGTFTRTGEAALVDPRGGWAFLDLTSPWKGTNEPRILGDGAILREGARTNLVPSSENFAAWSALGTPVRTGGQAAPDGASDAYLIADDSAAALEGVGQNITVAAATAYTLSCYVLKDSDTSRFPEFQFNEVTGGTGHLNVQLNTSSGATTVRSQAGLTSTSHGTIDAGAWWIFWMKFTTTGATVNGDYNIFPAIATTFGGLSNAATGSVTVWGAQLEAGSFQSSIIRTAGAGATRGGELMSFATIPLAIQSGRWKIAFSPVHNHDTGFAVVAQGATATEEIAFATGTGRFSVSDGGVTVVSSNVCTWNPYTRLELTFDAVAGSIGVAGALTGNGTVVGTTWTWPNTTTHIGSRSNGLSPAFAVFERPRAA